MAWFFRISIAGQNIEIECLYRTVFYQCKAYLNSFDMPDMFITTSFEEMEAEVETMQLPPIEESYEGVATNRSYGYIESVIVQRKIADGMLDFNTFLMHGSVVSYDNQAYMFTAASGVGKTTRVKLWLNEYPGAIVVNGDKPLVKVTDKQVIACGTPWCGKEQMNTNTMVPLRAIFLLERAEENEESSIKEISLGRAFPFLFRQTYKPENSDLLRKTLFLLKSLEGKVKIYEFRSTPTQEAIRLAYETAKPIVTI